MIQSPVSILIFITCHNVPIGSQVSQDTPSTQSPCLLSVHCFLIKRNTIYISWYRNLKQVSFSFRGMSSIRSDLFLRTHTFRSIFSAFFLRSFAPFFGSLLNRPLLTIAIYSYAQLCFLQKLTKHDESRLSPSQKGNRREIRIYETSRKYLPLRLQTSCINSLKQNFSTTVSEAATWAIGMDNTLFRRSFLSCEKFPCSCALLVGVSILYYIVSLQSAAQKLKLKEKVDPLYEEGHKNGARKTLRS